ncbi:alpha/beta hydrolase [Amycolatopsis sp. NPDC051061]|uniref:alpha/beta fold hydrolase n=1 Tax=Amycolatopsis sp. NPDC051061 TaxID=3155042 RepID=UPI003439A481
MSEVTSQDGTKIAYDRYGDGPPVILVGGAFQFRAFDPSTAQLAQLLGERFGAIHYDRRGRGESGDTKPYSTDREVEDIEALVDAAGGTASLFGMSSGAVLALDAAARLPAAKVAKVAVYEAPFIVDNLRPPLPEGYHDKLVELVEAGRPGDAVEHFLVHGAAVPPEFVSQMRGAPMWPGFESVAHTLVYDSALMGDGSVSADRWAGVRVPVLVSDGGASGPVMHNAAKALAGVLADARERTLEGQGHDVAPDVLAPVLEEFFAG